MLQNREREIEEEEKVETEERKVHADEPIEEMISSGILQEPPESQTEGEIEEEKELDKERVIERKLIRHKEVREGNTGEESHGLHRWFGFFSPRKGGEEGEKDKERKVTMPSSDEIIAGDSWQHGGGGGVMDGSNVHSPTEKGPLRDEQPTEMDEKNIFQRQREIWGRRCRKDDCGNFAAGHKTNKSTSVHQRGRCCPSFARDDNQSL